MLSRLQQIVGTILLGLAGLLALLLTHTRSKYRKEAKKNESLSKELKTQEKLRYIEREIQTARTESRAEAIKVEQEFRKREETDDRPTMFGDPRMRN